VIEVVCVVGLPIGNDRAIGGRSPVREDEVVVAMRAGSATDVWGDERTRYERWCNRNGALAPRRLARGPRLELRRLSPLHAAECAAAVGAVRHVGANAGVRRDAPGSGAEATLRSLRGALTRAYSFINVPPSVINLAPRWKLRRPGPYAGSQMRLRNR